VRLNCVGSQKPKGCQLGVSIDSIEFIGEIAKRLVTVVREYTEQEGVRQAFSYFSHRFLCTTASTAVVYLSHRNSVCSSVRHTGRSAKNGAS